MTSLKTPSWMRITLRVAGCYNIVWGTWVILFPRDSFAWSGMAMEGLPLSYPQLWQAIGMIVGVYGVGYIAAANDPIRHWPIVLVGMLGKIFGPIGFVYGVIRGESPPEGIAMIFFNDLIWWIPFGLMLRAAWNASKNQALSPSE
jgi:hypothetical protein